MPQMTNSPETDEQPEFITPGEASRIAYLTPRSLSRLADEGKIATIRPGKHRRYRRADVEALVPDSAVSSPDVSGPQGGEAPTSPPTLSAAQP